MGKCRSEVREENWKKRRQQIFLKNLCMNFQHGIGTSVLTHSTQLFPTKRFSRNHRQGKPFCILYLPQYWYSVASSSIRGGSLTTAVNVGLTVGTVGLTVRLWTTERRSYLEAAQPLLALPRWATA